MAYPDGAYFLADFPIPDASVTEEEAQAIVDRWISRVDKAAGGTAAVDADSEHIVIVGAGAEIEKKMLKRSGIFETPALDTDIARAEKLLAAYDAEHSTPSPPAYERSEGYVGWVF